jgi:hypothetical protein
MGAPPSDREPRCQAEEMLGRMFPGARLLSATHVFRKNLAGAQVDLSVLILPQSCSMMTLLLHLLRRLPFLCSSHRQLVLENLALRQQLALHRSGWPESELGSLATTPSAGVRRHLRMLPGRLPPGPARPLHNRRPPLTPNA